MPPRAELSLHAAPGRTLRNTSSQIVNPLLPLSLDQSNIFYVSSFSSAMYHDRCPPVTGAGRAARPRLASRPGPGAGPGGAGADRDQLQAATASLHTSSVHCAHVARSQMRRPLNGPTDSDSPPADRDRGPGLHADWRRTRTPGPVAVHGLNDLQFCCRY
jgi:hypothetical protein